MRQEVYVSVDIEATGPIPGPYSMLSVGAAAFLPGSRVPISTFEVNLAELDGASWHPDTELWWKRFPDALRHATFDPRPPDEAMRSLTAWAKSLPGKPVMVVYPVWDFMWLHWYLISFTGSSPFGLSALDVKSLAFTRVTPPRGSASPSFHATSKANMPDRWFEGCPAHTHVALDDAIEQGVTFINILSEALETSEG